METEKITPEIMANATEIYAGLEVENGKAYRPSNGSEGSIFMAYWCDRCLKDSPLLNTNCNILADAFCGGHPNEWVYQDNKPVCTAFILRQ